MTEAEKLVNRQIADTKHAKRGGSFNPFSSRRHASRPVEDKTDKTGLRILSYPKRKGA